MVFLGIFRVKICSMLICSMLKNYCDIFKTYFDDIEYENEYYAKQILFNKPLETMEQLIDKMNNISLEELNKVVNELFDFNKMHIITFGNITERKIKTKIKTKIG